jgi:hypothetical protein
MKSLMILAAVVAISMAVNDLASFQACVDEVKGFRDCMAKDIGETMRKNMEQMKGFKGAIDKCFEKDGVKGICTMPPMPSPPPHPQWTTPAGGFPALPAEVTSCISGAQKSFFTCLKSAANIPDGFKPSQGAQGGPPQMQHGPPPMMGHPQFPHANPQELKAKVLAACGGNADAAKALEQCGMEAMKSFASALAPPMKVACDAAAACKQAHPISDDCKVKLQQGREAFCKCREEFPKFVNTSSTCEAARATFKARQQAHDAAVQHVDAAAAVHHDFPQHPQERLDFCGAQNHEDICAKLQKGQ